MKAQKGFTLVELLMAVAIIAVLAGVVVPRVLDYRNQARLSECESNISNMERLVEVFKFETEALPTVLDTDIRNSTNFPHGLPTCKLPASLGASSYSLDLNTGAVTCDHTDL